MGCSEYLLREIRFGIYEAPVDAFVPGKGCVMPGVPQTVEDKLFAQDDLEEGLRTGIYSKVSREEVMAAVDKGSIISSAFVVWAEKDAERRGRLVINLNAQSKHWTKGSVRMETISEFAMNVQVDDHFLSMDIEK